MGPQVKFALLLWLCYVCKVTLRPGKRGDINTTNMECSGRQKKHQFLLYFFFIFAIVEEVRREGSLLTLHIVLL